ncbi:unnamed protein product, partial [Trichogramma brassicae]
MSRSSRKLALQQSLAQCSSVIKRAARMKGIITASTQAKVPGVFITLCATRHTSKISLNTRHIYHETKPSCTIAQVRQYRLADRVFTYLYTEYLPIYIRYATTIQNNITHTLCE